MKNITKGFEIFLKDINGVGAAFMGAVTKMAEVSALDKKVHELVYISVLVTTKMHG